MVVLCALLASRGALDEAFIEHLETGDMTMLQYSDSLKRGMLRRAQADARTLQQWALNVPDARRLEDVF